MDRRTITALVLMALVIVITPMLFPSKKQPPRAETTLTAVTALGDTARTTALPTMAAAPPVAKAATPTTTAPATPTSRLVAAESVVVATPRAQYTFTNPGAALASVRVTGYRTLKPGARDTTLLLEQPKGAPLLQYRLANGADTVSLDTIPFTVARNGATTTFTSTSPAMTLSYQTTPDGYTTAVHGSVTNAPAGTSLIVTLPSELKSNEVDTLDDQRHLAYGYKLPLRDPSSVLFSKLDQNVPRVDTGSFQWVNARNKYWLIALMQPVGATKPAGVFRDLRMSGGARVGRIAPTASASTSVPLANGQFAFDVYTGPQKWDELLALKNDLQNVNPYAGFMHAVVQPFAAIVMRALLWMKGTFHVSYGWVLVIFGIAVRVLLWPLNAKAMRTSMAMQRLQPELTELQKKYKNEPDKQRDALVKLYSSHGMSPLSPMLGCLPALLPMPVLFALYFVFQNTIEFRGVPFLWLTDISLRDPYYIIPFVMGASMFLLSWIGMRNMPPNPQTKMMSYMMPVMFTVMFLNFASGLNLYYASQNIAALPQQWFISKERQKNAAAGAGNASVKKKT
jgi:YidC/Oxa1 family membrane protein insertase